MIKRSIAAAAVLLASCGGGDSTPVAPPVATPPAAPTPTPTQSPSPPPLACAATTTGNERWPEYAPAESYSAAVAVAIGSYRAGIGNHRPGPHDWRTYYLPNGYLPGGPYVTIQFFATLGPDTRFDDLGVPMVLANGEWVYNPTTIANFALYHHTRYTQGIPLPSAFWAAVGKLQSMVEPDGAIRYSYPSDGIPAGWVSAMAQGQVLSVFSRAYLLSKDQSLVVQGNRVLDFMLKPVDQGGTRGSLANLDPSLSSYVSLYEYAPEVSSHTLNGFLFSIFGLYDWAMLDAPGVSKVLAKTAFDCGVHTVASALPYYDAGGFSTYDLDHLFEDDPDMGPIYHKIHIAQLVSLYSITKNPALLHWARQWAPPDQPVPG